MPEAGRVITGSAGGLRLAAPGPGTRPLSDRVKQALFALLESERPDAWGLPMLDLFAGSGAAGIEALSRGAPAAVFVERDARAAAIVVANLRSTGLGARGRVVRRDVLAFLAAGPGETPEAPFGTCLVDPPYERTADLAATLAALGAEASAWLVDGACVAAKHFWRAEPDEAVGRLGLVRRRRFGETALSVYRREH